MNLKGSYRALQSNSKAAILAAIEIYNKPQITYRDECFCILLVNAWELLLKAVLSKYKQRIYYPKKRNQPYRTFSIDDTLRKSEPHFPAEVSFKPVAENIRALVTYRDNAIHFYNQKGFSVLIYGLAQTSIVNFRDLTQAIFDIDIGEEMTISLLPLGLGSQPDPIEFLQKSRTVHPKNKAVAQYLREISNSTKSLEEQHYDTARFLTVFTVKFQSIKQVSGADIITGVDASNTSDEDLLIVQRTVNPNISHPLRQKDILEEIGNELKSVKFTQYTFQAIVWKYKIESQSHLMWRSKLSGSPQYSREMLAFVKRLTEAELLTALSEYKEYNRIRRTQSQ